MLPVLELSIPEHDTTQGIDARTERAAQQVGAQTAEIEHLPFDLSVMEDEGLFVNVDAAGFGLLDRRLDWHALGITLPRESNVAFRPPRCGLLPDRYRLPLLRPAARAHAALHRYSYHFRLTETVFESPAYRWIPWRAFEAFERDFQAAQADLERAKAALLAHYDAVREEVIQTFLRLAADSIRRLEATGQGVPDGFEDVIVQGVQSAIPKPDDVKAKLILRYRVGVILLGSEMLAEQRKAREEHSRLEEAEANVRLERQQRDAQERVLQRALWAEEERIRRQAKAEEDEQRREAEVKERLRQLKLDAAKERLQEAMSPLEEGAKQLHAAIYESASAIRASLQKHQYLPGSSAKRARELTRWYTLMNWQSDEQLERLIGELESLSSRPTGKRKRDVGALDHVLGDIVELCYADARALTEPSRMGALEL
jgi:hypothetical protein